MNASETYIRVKLQGMSQSLFEALDVIEDLVVLYPEDEGLQELYGDLRDCLKPAYYRVVSEEVNRALQKA